MNEMDVSIILKNFKKTLYNNTLNNLLRHKGTIIKGRAYTEMQAEEDAAALVEDTSSYLVALLDTGLVDDNSIEKVLTNIVKNVKGIDYLPTNERGIFGVLENSKVFINPDLSPERKKLYLFHELTHGCMKSMEDAPYIGNYKRYSTFYGYMVLEEGITQNIAETCFYKIMRQNRPAKRYETDRIFQDDRIKFKTNYDYYGLYQPLVIAFGKTLRGVGSVYDNSDDKILYDISKRALKEDLLDSIIFEYETDGKIDELTIMLFGLANIYSAKLKSFTGNCVYEKIFDKNGKCLEEMKLEPSADEIVRSYQYVLNKTTELEDYRPEVIR